MTTLIFEIGGTLTDLSEIERRVIAAMLPPGIPDSSIDMRADLYRLYCRLSKKRPTKSSFRRQYGETFRRLRRDSLLPKPNPYEVVWFILKMH